MSNPRVLFSSISLANFALLMVWTFTDQTGLAIFNGVAAILSAITASEYPNKASEK